MQCPTADTASDADVSVACADKTRKAFVIEFDKLVEVDSAGAPTNHVIDSLASKNFVVTADNASKKVTMVLKVANADFLGFKMMYLH